MGAELLGRGRRRSRHPCEDLARVRHLVLVVDRTIRGGRVVGCGARDRSGTAPVRILQLLLDVYARR